MSAFIATLTDNPRVTILTGAGGSGKSTLLRYLAAEMIQASESRRTNYIPLLLQCQAWDPRTGFKTWLSDRVLTVYGISPRITASWLNRGKAVLLLDGVDELPEDNWNSFVVQINSFLRSPVAGRAVLSCRYDSYVRYLSSITHEQVASLQPLSDIEIRRFLSDILAPRVHDKEKLDEYRSLIHNVVLPGRSVRSEWSTPLMLRILASGVLNDDALPIDSESSDDPGAVAVRLGDTLSKQGDSKAAITSYLAAATNQASAWRSLGGARASLLLAHSGDFEGARNALQLSLASELERSMNEPVISPNDELTDDDRTVLGALSSTISLDAFQVSSAASVPPNRANEALRRLRDRGLVEVIDAEKGEPRFCKSSVELVDQ
jgi:hypothetical protein